MEAKCCKIDVTPIEGGYRIEITGDCVTEKCADMLKQCCGSECSDDECCCSCAE